MSDDDAQQMSRRALLRKTAATGAVGATGIATASISATAASFEPGDIVEVTSYHVPTMTRCCDFHELCPGGDRQKGDTGEVVGTCDRGGNDSYVWVQVYWHNLRGSRSVTYIDDWYIEHAD
ncbi:hypothetical protein OB920_14180 [Halobacteria archaeon HArc-gm2]|nr:hypothetical protein [Halobacteria archaeon HArc-gm2]